MAFNFFMPQHSIFGKDAFLDLIVALKKAQSQKVLIITDKFLHEQTEHVQELINLLEKNQIKTSVFADVQPNPTTKNVESALQKLNRIGADLVIGFGGGSPCDVAKVVCLLKTNKGRVQDYWGVDLAQKPAFPLVIVNTTAGTATEVTKNAVITDLKTATKMVIVDQYMIPMIAVNNPSWTLNLPKNLTAYTGMDALTHAIEAFVNYNNILLTDEFALLAIKLIKENLVLVYNNPQDYAAREKMIYAEYLAGMTFNSVGLGIIHAMSHPLSAFYELSHGLCNAVLLPHLLKMNLVYDDQKAQKLAEALGGVNLKTKSEIIDYIFTTLISLNEALNIPTDLKSFPVQREDLDELAFQAKNDVCAAGNPKPMDEVAIKEMYLKIMNYQLVSE